MRELVLGEYMKPQLTQMQQQLLGEMKLLKDRFYTYKVTQSLMGTSVEWYWVFENAETYYNSLETTFAKSVEFSENVWK